MCHDVYYIWWDNLELEFQEWEDFIKSKKYELFLFLSQTRIYQDKNNMFFLLSRIPLDKALQW